MKETLINQKKLYKENYLELQKEWKSIDKELLFVGRLAYWTFLVSKYAEKCEGDEKKQIFELKARNIFLLQKSNFVKIKKYTPMIHKKLCVKHAHAVRNYSKKYKRNFFHSLNNKKFQNTANDCKNCQKGEKNYYSLFSIAILSGYGESTKRPYYILYLPYKVGKNSFPNFNDLEKIKKDYQGEFGTYITNKKMVENIPDVYSNKLIIKKANEAYENLEKYYAKR